MRASRSSGNSSGRTASVEPAALHMPSASEPDLRPMHTTTYQRAVVRASSMRLSRMPAPTERAVSKPNVGALSGSGRSLSIVFGTVATPMRPRVRSAILRRAVGRVVAADADEIANAERVERGDAAFERRFVVGRIGARGAQDRAAARVDARDVIEGQLDGLRRSPGGEIAIAVVDADARAGRT